MAALLGKDEEFYLNVEVSDNIAVELTTAEDEFNASKKTLFATYLWTGSTLLGKELIKMDSILTGQSVLEFGAASGLPSIVSAKMGASRVCASDYPSPCVIEALKKNLVRNGVDEVVKVVEHIWGESVESLVVANEGRLYDVVLAAECLWRHESHQALLDSIKSVLKRNGTLLMTYSHHIPGLEESDDHFFALCEGQDLVMAERQVLQGKAMWNDGMVDIYFCRLLHSPEDTAH